MILNHTILSGKTLKSAWPIAVIASFAFVYVASLTFVYVEGDDALSIAYHVLGRDSAIQPPYSPYHSLMDIVLSLLPPEEPLLRHAVLLITSVAAVTFVILTLVLSFAWSSGIWRTPKILLGLVVLLAAPELFYFGLVYTPSVIAMCLMIAAHLVVRSQFCTSAPREAWRFWLSCALFALGGAARWDTILYGAVIVGDLILVQEASNLQRRTTRGVLWGGSALLGWLLMVALTGYSPIEVVDAIRSSGPVETPSLLLTVRMQSLLTPGFVLLGLIGFARIIRTRWQLAALIVVSAALVARLAVFGVPKWIISSIPALLYCVLMGFDLVWAQRKKTTLNYTVSWLVLVLLLVPWVFGLQMVWGDKAWGPGFEIRPIDRRRMEGVRAEVVIGAGAAVPTPEGPRALLGHGAVLLGGKWRELALSRTAERRMALELAIREGVPIVTDGGPTAVLCDLARLGYRTRDPKYRWVRNGFVVAREFTSREAENLLLLSFFNRVPRWGDDDIEMLRSVADSDSVVILAFSSTLRELYQTRPEMMTSIGRESAVLQLVPQETEGHEQPPEDWTVAVPG